MSIFECFAFVERFLIRVKSEGRSSNEDIREEITLHLL
jgi:hypothetical protein